MSFKFGRKFILSAIITALWMMVIFMLSAQTGDESSSLSSKILFFLCGLFDYSPYPDAVQVMSFCIRKAAHMTEFGLLGLLMLNTLWQGFGRFRGIYALSGAAASLYAATDEMHQLFVGDRAGQFTDWLIDSSGIILWMLTAWILIKALSRRSRKASADA